MSSNPSLTQTVAGELRAEMARQRKTGIDLAEVLQCSQQSASRRMTGSIGLDLDELDRVAAWLGLTPAHFMRAPAPVAS